jgi:putative OPT family oligopeptide transporter
MQDRAFMRFDYLNNAAVLGIGYIIGLRYTAIIAAGSFFATFVLVPMVHGIAYYVPVTEIVPPGAIPMAEMGPTAIFRDYVRIIGVGCIAGAGVMGVLSSLPNMMRSIVSNLKALGDKSEKAVAPTRTERSIPGSFVAIGLVVFTLATIVFFSFGINITNAIVPALLGTAVVMVISFFFAPVAARAIATIGTNPISGMTMLTLLITGLVMLKLGFTGGVGMFVTMMVGGVVCTALAASGAFSTDLKIGHWIGSTPARQIGWKFVGTLVAALFCGVAMYVMSKGGFGAEGQYSAPQASAMRAILEGIFGETAMPLRWYFFALGIVLSLVLRIIALPALGFALGMYLPIELNTPLFLGGILSYFVTKAKAGDTPEIEKARENKGILIASGLMAGGAIMGVIGAIARMNPRWKDGFYLLNHQIIEGGVGEWLALIGTIALCSYIVISSKQTDKA